MSSVQLPNKSAITSIASGDILYVVHDPSGTPSDGKLDISVLRTYCQIGTLLAANNLNDIGSASAARSNLGLGSAAVESASAFDAAGAAAAALSTANGYTDTGLAGKANTSHTHALSALTQSGATTGQIPKWDGSAWAPANESGGGGSQTPWISDIDSAGYALTTANVASGVSNNLILRTGTDTNTDGSATSGDVNIQSGVSYGSNYSGGVVFSSGNGVDALSNSGNTNINTGSVIDGISGNVNIGSGAVSGTGTSGDVNVESGTGTNRGTVRLGGSSVSCKIFAGAGTFSVIASDDDQLLSVSADGSSLTLGNATDGDTISVTRTASPNVWTLGTVDRTSTGNSEDVVIKSGDVVDGTSGAVHIKCGTPSGSGNRGTIHIGSAGEDVSNVAIYYGSVSGSVLIGMSGMTGITVNSTGIGFNNASPVAQGEDPGDAATDAVITDVVAKYNDLATKFNALLAYLVSRGDLFEPA